MTKEQIKELLDEWKERCINHKKEYNGCTSSKCKYHQLCWTSPAFWNIEEFMKAVANPCEATDESHLVHIGTPKSPKFKCTACGEVCYCYQAKNRQKTVCDYQFCPHCGKIVKEKEE